MCDIIRHGKVQIETVEELIKEFPDIKLERSKGRKVIALKCCLCQVDLERTFRENKIEYERNEFGEYVIK